MEFDTTTVLARLILNTNKNLPNILRQREENLKNLECRKSKIGKWIQDFEMPVLIEILNSPDDYFHEKFPDLKTFGLLKRQELAKEIQKHAGICERCKLKVQYDSEWENIVETSVFNHRESLKKTSGKRKEFFKKRR